MSEWVGGEGGRDFKRKKKGGKEETYPPGQNLPVYKNTTVKLITNKPAYAVVRGRVKEAELSELELKPSLTVARPSSVRVSVNFCQFSMGASTGAWLFFMAKYPRVGLPWFIERE